MQLLGRQLRMCAHWLETEKATLAHISCGAILPPLLRTDARLGV